MEIFRVIRYGYFSRREGFEGRRFGLGVGSDSWVVDG